MSLPLAPAVAGLPARDHGNEKGGASTHSKPRPWCFRFDSPYGLIVVVVLPKPSRPSTPYAVTLI